MNYLETLFDGSFDIFRQAVKVIVLRKPALEPSLGICRTSNVYSRAAAGFLQYYNIDSPAIQSLG